MKINPNILTGFFLLFSLLLVNIDLLAQRKVLSIPVAFKEPLDLGVGVIPDTRAKDKETPWLVVSDREDNKVYSEPSENSAVASTINFREAFYVVEEKGDWIQLVNADVVGNLKIPESKPVTVLGWVQKKNMLLWTSGLLNQFTRIHQKVCLLNRADAADEIDDRMEKVDVYKGPTSGQIAGEIKIYSFYFILKKEGDRYLLCEEDAFNKRYLDKIIGWVKRTRCAEWNTRIALEPNFEKEASDERRLTPAFQLHGYNDREAARMYGQTGDPTPISGTKLLWDQDPVRLDANDKLLARTNSRRYIGQRLRFPVLAPEQSALNLDVFRTGVLGSIKVKRDGSGISYGSSIPEEIWLQIKKYREKADKAAKNINVCFVIEGSAGMAAYKDRITAAINSIHDEYKGKVENLKFAAVVYRGPYEKDVVIGGRKVDKRLEYTPLTPDQGQVVNWINQQEFASWNDNMDYKALYYGISKTIEKVNFDHDATNIMIVVGNSGDYRADQYIGESLAKDETRVKASDVVNALAKYKTHLYALQCINNQKEESVWFGKHMRYLMLESSRTGYVNSYGKKDDDKAAKIRSMTNQDSEPPLMSDDDKDLKVVLDKGLLWPGWLIRAKGAQPPAEVQSLPLLFTKASFERVNGFNNKLKKVIDDGEAMKDSGPEDFPADMAAFLYDMAKGGKVPFQNVTDLMGKKFQIFTEEYFPQKISNAKYPMFSYVLFMPQSDLNRYQQLIHNYISTNIPVSKMRENLENIYRELIVQFTGNDKLLKDFKTMSVSDVSEVVQGVYGEGLNLSVPIDVVIKDLKNERKTPDAVIIQLNDRFQDVEKKIGDILRRDNYEFMYDSGVRKYYWIPVEDMF